MIPHSFGELGAWVDARLSRLAKLLHCDCEAYVAPLAETWAWSHWDAEQGGPQVFISEQMLEIASDKELAFVLAHEIGHNKLRHSYNAGMAHELEADAYALALVKKTNLASVSDAISIGEKTGIGSERLEALRVAA